MPNKKKVLSRISMLEAGPDLGILNISMMHRVGPEPFSLTFSHQCPMTDLILEKPVLLQITRKVWFLKLAKGQLRFLGALSIGCSVIRSDCSVVEG